MNNPVFAVFAFFAGLLTIRIILGMTRAFGFYACVQECEAQVFTLFGKVLGTLDEPGLHFPVAKFGPKAILLPFFGKRHRVSTALRQHYLRNQMVNSEEGTPMGVGIWGASHPVGPKAPRGHPGHPVEILENPKWAHGHTDRQAHNTRLFPWGSVSDPPKGRGTIRFQTR